MSDEMTRLILMKQAVEVATAYVYARNRKAKQEHDYQGMEFWYPIEEKVVNLLDELDAAVQVLECRQ